MTKSLRVAAFAALAAAICVSCSPRKAENRRMMSIDTMMTKAEIDAGLMTPEVMWKMGRIGGATLSPDGGNTVYTVTYYNMAENKGVTSLYLLRSGSQPEQITDNSANDTDPQWSGDGSRIFFLSDRSGDTQLWAIDCESFAMVKISDVADGIDGYGVTQRSDRLYYLKGVQIDNHKTSVLYPDMDKSMGRVYDDLMARHWDRWGDGIYKHIFITSLDGNKMGEATDIMPNEPWDSPLAPYFDNSEIAWSGDGTMLAYTSKKKTGAEYATNTDSDIFLYDVQAGTTRNMTPQMNGFDKHPSFSPDGTKLAFTSMITPGYESDRERLMVLDLASGQVTELTKNFDYSAQNIVWHNNSTIYFIAPTQGLLRLCRADLSGAVDIISQGERDVNSFSMAAGHIVASVTTHSMATELFDIDPLSGDMAQITHVNQNIYSSVKMGRSEKRWVETTDGKQMLTWVVYPPDFDPSKKYPTLLYCQGGPQSIVSQFWSYRWNLQVMAAKGYIVVAPNRRGTPSFGQEWLQQISGDYSGQNIRDYLSAIDALSAEPYVDSDRLGCVGASYGGYSSLYLMGHHKKRFKAFISHCGIFNFESMYGSTEELWFVDFDYGGPYWDKNATAQRSYANSAHKFVREWDTPLLLIAGLNDFRVPYTQSLEAFTAARLRGIDSRLVVYENEAHQVFKPQNSITWNREFFGWLDKYLKNGDDTSSTSRLSI